MMSSESVQSLTDPVFRSKMPLFDRTLAATGLSKPQNMSGFLDKQTLQYRGAYFAYDPTGKDGAEFTSPWSNVKTSLLEGRSPMSHHPDMEGQSHIIYRQDSNEEGHAESSSRYQAPVRPGFAIYTKSPEASSPATATPVAVGKQKTGGDTSSPTSENSVYLAIPKPVYGHNPCCNELGCVIGHRYSMEHGSPSIPKTIYEHDWMQNENLYTDRPPAQRKAQGPLLQQRGLQFEPSSERLKRIAVEAYSPRSARALSAMIDPNYSGYPCSPTRPLFGSLSEQSQRLQTSPRGYSSLYPSHPTYEHMTSEVYREHSPMSKYGQITQHPMFYYPQANEEVQNSTRCKTIGNKQREDVPVILRRTIATPREHYIVPQSLHGEIPLTLPNAETLPNHSFIQGYDYPCYAVPRFHLNASQIRAPLKRQHASPGFHTNRINVSLSSQHRDHLLASATNLHKDKTNSSMHVEQAQPSLPFLRVDQTSPTRCVSQPGVIPPSIPHMKRFFSPLSSLHMDRHILSPAGLNINRLMDYSSCEAQVTCPQKPKGLPVSPAAWLPQSSSHSLDHIPTAVTNSANVRKIIYSPAVATGNKYNGPTSSSGSTVVTETRKRSISHSSPTTKIKIEGRDLCEVELAKKRQKVEMETAQVKTKTGSPLMPVIDNVFSLAPYQAYLQASGVLFPGRVPQRTVQSSEHCELKTQPDKEKRPVQDKQQTVVCLAPKEISQDTPKEKPVVEIFDPKNIKVEKVDPSEADDSVESPVSQQDCSKVIVKKEPEESGSFDNETMLVIKKCEPDELESKPSLTGKTETSDESKPVELTVQMNSSSQDHACTLHEQISNLPSESSTSPQPSENKPKFKNIPPQCLKLSTYKIILPDMKPPPPEKPPALPISDLCPKLELQMPVRKHFIELHHSLCKLMSKSVSASSEQELRTWLSQVELPEPASPSVKDQKVSRLLGVKARELWLNEEMKKVLHQVLERLREYTAQKRCPFPHVMRTGAVFLPMLVIKELLFPVVEGSFIDQVLQEHKVELRPTTLSEEKILIQLHKRACSSRLRRLMSLKHLPDIYADVINLLYYTYVCKHLGLDTDDPANRGKDGDGEESRVFSDVTASLVSPPESHPQKHTKNQEETKSHLNRNRTKSRVKSSSRRMFLDNSLSDEEDADAAEMTVEGGNKYKWSVDQSEESENRGSDDEVEEADASFVPPSPTSVNSWTCPLSLDELSSSLSDTETEKSSSPQPDSQSSASNKSRSKSSSGMILKLRRMFSEGINRKKAHYEAVSDSVTFAGPSLSNTGDLKGDVSRRVAKVTHKWQRTGSFCHALRPLSSSSKRKHRSLLKIKYCPYLSACHSAEHRRRWVLRSAVQRARRAMRFYYPDLVGKRIRHLYEEDDKSEVWYRGEVLRIHEAHTNPLKTIFEVRYDSEPEWKYYLELLIDYKKGWLKIED